MGLNPSEKRNILAAVSRVAILEEGLEYLGGVVDQVGAEVLKLRTEVDALKPKKPKDESREVRSFRAQMEDLGPPDPPEPKSKKSKKDGD